MQRYRDRDKYQTEFVMERYGDTERYWKRENKSDREIRR